MPTFGRNCPCQRHGSKLHKALLRIELPTQIEIVSMNSRLFLTLWSDDTLWRQSGNNQILARMMSYGSFLWPQQSLPATDVPGQRRLFLNRLSIYPCYEYLVIRNHRLFGISSKIRKINWRFRVPIPKGKSIIMRRVNCIRIEEGPIDLSVRT